MRREVAASYCRCRRVARESASSFYWSFWLLPRRKRDAMCALYAFSRHTDDLVDKASAANPPWHELAAWRDALTAALHGRCEDPILPALADSVARYSIPTQYLYQLIEGVAMDAVTPRFETFGDLRQYCYLVASVVGLSCVHIWGFNDPRILEPATACGIAFQLTNILRDLPEDARRGRVYLPAEDLRQYRCKPDYLLRDTLHPSVRSLVAFEMQRTEQFYREAQATGRYLSRDGRRAFSAMYATYYALLQEIRRRDGDVFSSRVQLTRRHKLAIALRHLFRPLPTCPGPGPAASKTFCKSSMS